MQWLWETNDMLQPVILYRAYAEVLEEALERWINEGCGRGTLIRRQYLVFDGAPEPKSE